MLCLAYTKKRFKNRSKMKAIKMGPKHSDNQAHVIWKRPDGFHGATPEDYYVIEVNGHSRLWLHKKNKDSFPFRVAGGWEEEASTERLNRLVHLINQDESTWLRELAKQFDTSAKTDSKLFINSTISWIEGLRENIKGDKWEIEIVAQALDYLSEQIKKISTKFFKTHPHEG